ncbi:hypothetical protein H0H92_010893 [Tricholoma furcatifolium]|nr:hypothetical protein H0H92_010893 [Tricholoma furcatifolium]
MPVTCSGCGASFKSTGWKNHIRQTNDPNCRGQAWSSDSPPGLLIRSLTILEGLKNKERESEIVVDPAGDLFGDYGNLNDTDITINEDANESDEQEDGEDGDEDWEEEGTGLEALRAPVHCSTIDDDSDSEDAADDGLVLRLHGGVEGTLLEKPYIIEWEIAKWAKLCGPSSTAFTELMNIDGVLDKLGLSFSNSKELNKIIDKQLPGRPQFQRQELLIGGEVCEMFYRDVLECIRALLGDPDFAAVLVFLPEKHYTDEEQRVRMYHDMHTGKWWWSTQEAVEKDKPGATLVPIIISTDKTQLTLFRNKSAYPIYITIGNIPKEIRCKPTNRAYVLLGYLPTTRLENVENQNGRCCQLANLYHACMAQALEPLRSAGIDGVFMTTSDSLTRQFHPILACVVMDYPEQFLTAGTYNGECPTCPTPRDKMGDYNSNSSYPPLRDLSHILDVLDSFETDPANFLQACKAAGIKPLVDPYWKNLPYVHIYRSITPDVLHQLYQGVLKHLIQWVIAAYGAPEIDARCRRLPPNHNIRLFMKGISTLLRVTGQEHDQMCRILLGLIIDAPLPDSQSSARLLRAVRAMLDFLYLAQYPVHTDRTLELLDVALEGFHGNKQIFIDLGIREGFNIPKLHWAQHYIDAIRLYGTTDNVNTQYTERLHIDLAKSAYAATNRKDEFSQMTIWLERKEKILRHAQYIQVYQDRSETEGHKEWSPPGLELDRSLHMTKHPSVRAAVSFERLATAYGAEFFRTALARFVAITNEPGLQASQLERRLWTVRIPFTKVHVWHKIKFHRIDPMSSQRSTADSIHVRPSKQDSRGRWAPGRFDTALINNGTGDVTGINGTSMELPNAH